MDEFTFSTAGKADIAYKNSWTILPKTTPVGDCLLYGLKTRRLAPLRLTNSWPRCLTCRRCLSALRLEVKHPGFTHLHHSCMWVIYCFMETATGLKTANTI